MYVFKKKLTKIDVTLHVSKAIFKGARDVIGHVIPYLAKDWAKLAASWHFFTNSLKLTKIIVSNDSFTALGHSFINTMFYYTDVEI